MLHGVGGAAVYTLSPTYLDENTKQKNTPLYLGFMQSFAALGPAVGYIAGGLFLSVYVDAARPGHSTELVDIYVHIPYMLLIGLYSAH